MALSIKNDDADRLARELAEDFRRLPVLDPRSADEILGYDEHGLPGRWWSTHQR